MREHLPERWLLIVVGVCAVLNGCRGLVSSPNVTGGIKNVNHIIFMEQENRSLDHYFGTMRQYWAQNGFPDQSFDGLPQFNPASGAKPLQGPVPTNQGCDPAFPYNPTANPPQTSDCVLDSNSPQIASFHLQTMCMENPSPFWNESHVDFNMTNPVSGTSTLDGFVWAAAHDSRTTLPPFNDTNGTRAMGYYDGRDLPYYYFLASSFGTSDRWFSPVMTRTQANRMYSLAATSAGHLYPLPPGSAPLSNPTIFDLLQAAGVSWKVYVTDLNYAVQPIQDSALNMFATAGKYPQNIVPVSEYFTDVKNGTLPAVAYVEPGYDSGLDEHPTTNDLAPENIQEGAKYVSTLINGLMQSPSWKDSIFILTFDEFGGIYDHVPPQAAVSPDGIKPSDLNPGDICTTLTGPTCDFTYTGYRTPLIVVSPFSKRNYVSHSVADHTAWLKLVETRFGVANLTSRDKAQIDMTEFFDFGNVPWQVPPAPPAQPTGGACYVNSLP
jgi:phospholipase C